MAMAALVLVILLVSTSFAQRIVTVNSTIRLVSPDSIFELANGMGIS